MPDSESAAEPGLLRWRCRRGMKELDLLLSGWLQHHYPQATSEQRRLFGQLLELPDPELAAYLLGHAQSADTALADFISGLRNLRC